MNRLSTARRAAIVTALAEGNSIRSTCRITGTAKQTVLDMISSLGAACADYQDAVLRDLPCKRLQCDEIWSFCYAKARNVEGATKAAPGAGDVWTWTAVCSDTKLVPSWLVGARDAEYARDFMTDLAGRMAGRVQLTTDGFGAYLDAVGADHVIHIGGKIPEDWWQIAIAPRGSEGLGYPTQKPIKLLRRIVSAASNKGDIVLDPFCGCGTTLEAAQLLGRKWIGIDISTTAVELMKRRLGRIGTTGIKLVGMPVTEGQLRALKPFEFQNWVIQRYVGTHAPRKSGDMGIDGFSFLEHLPIQVKQSDDVGRNVVDNFETAVDRNGKKKGYIVAFSFTRGAYEEAARAKTKGITIDLVEIASLLKDAPDIVTPQSGLLGDNLPLPPPRPANARPSVEELVRSGRSEEPLRKVAEDATPYRVE